MIFPNNQLLKVSMYFSCTTGSWPIIFMSNKRLKSIYNVFTAILYYYNITHILRGFFHFMLLISAEHWLVEEIFSNLCTNLIYTTAMLRVKALNSKEVTALFVKIIETEEVILGDANLTIRTIYMRCVRNNYIYNFLIIANGSLLSAFYLSRPILLNFPTMVVNNKTITMQGLSTWLPINTQKYYWTAYGWNIFDGGLSAAYVINSDILMFCLIVFTLSQLNVLSYKLKNFKHHGATIIGDNIYRQLFISLMKDHKKIITFINQVNKTMKYVMLFDFLQGSLQLASVILQVLIMDFNVRTVTLIGYFVSTMILRLIIYYYNANEVIYQSENLAMDIWLADWYEQDEDVKKMILFFMARAQRPLNFHIGPFGIMSLPVFLSILKATYSYIMLFVKIKN